MADFNSSLPVRTQNNGDVVIQIADRTVTTQKAAVDTAGGQIIAGEGVAGTPAGGVVSIQGVSGGTAIPVSGTVTASNPSVSSTGAAVPASATFVGGQASTAAPTYTTGNLSALSLNLSGGLRVDGSGVTQPVSGTVTANQGGAPWSQNLTQLVGAAPSASNSLPVQITNGTAFNSLTNPLFVSQVSTAGTPIDSYQTSASVASGSSVNLDYTVSASKTFHSEQVLATGSGKIKVQVMYETAAGSGTFNTFFTGFNSTATPNVLIPIPSGKTQVTGARIRVTITNTDVAAQDVYSTLSGTEQ